MNSNPVEKRIIVGGLIVKDGKFVMVREKKEEARGLWNFPMGKLEGNETLAAGAKREMEEETGLTVALQHLIGIYQLPKSRTGRNIIEFIYLASVVSDELRCPPDLMDARWMTVEDFEKIPDNQHRNMMRKVILQDWLAGRRYPLDFVRGSVSP